MLAIMPTEPQTAITQQLPEEPEHDDFRTYAALLSDKEFWVELVRSTVEQEMDNIPPRQMQFSKEQHYVFQQLSRDCLHCQRAYTNWYSKMQHVSYTEKKTGCRENGASAFEVQLWNIHYELAISHSKINKRKGKFHSVIDEMIDLAQHSDMEDFSQLPLSLTASMPPPDYYHGWTIVNSAEIERVD